MVVAAALVSFGVSLLVGWVLGRRARRRIGPSWQEWRAAARLAGPGSYTVSVAAGAATLVGLCGFGVPGVLRAALLAAVAGLCLPFAAAGVRRYQHG